MRFLSFVGFLLMIVTSCSKNQPTQKLYVGTYTDGSSEGIYTLAFNPNNGTLDSLTLKAKLPSPSFLALSENREFLYGARNSGL